jgi:6-phosphogluconolactonase
MTAPGEREIEVVTSPAELAERAAARFTELANRALGARGRFTVALAGGSTPRALYSVLADPAGPFRSRIAWQRIEFFWGDERHVPPEHPDSNFRMATEAMLARVPVSPQQVHRIEAELASAEAAERYEGVLRSVFDLAPGELARFDLVLLGMGSEGHTGSLFPGSAALHEERRQVVAVWVEKLGVERITLTPPVLNAARCVIFLVAGGEKAATLHEVLEGELRPDTYPAQAVQPTDGDLVWLVDRAAAAGLRVSP